MSQDNSEDSSSQDYSSEYEPNIVGLCGRAGSGKSTIEKIICVEPVYREIIVNNRLNFIAGILQGLVPKDRLKNLINSTIESSWGDRLDVDGEYKVYIRDLKNMDINMYNALSFAEPLKILASIIYEYDFITLLGLTVESREKRETVKSRRFGICGEMTGRQALEFLGTDVFRNHLHPDIWLNIAVATIAKYMSKGYSICISDVHYENEYKAIKSHPNGEIWVVYRDLQDFQITSTDLSSHISKYAFLKFIDLDTDTLISNKETIPQLKSKVYALLDWLE